MQRPEDTLRLRSGSCRDFALFMMEAVRSLGFAARFVSGYIFVPETDPAAAGVGGGATHAWMQVYLPGAGWVDFDPTNSIVGNRNLIRVAVAWDHGQALPLWGKLHRRGVLVPRHGRRGQRHRNHAGFIAHVTAATPRQPGCRAGTRRARHRFPLFYRAHSRFEVPGHRRARNITPHLGNTRNALMRNKGKQMNLFDRVLAAGLLGVVLVAGPVREASARPQAAKPAAAPFDDGTLQSQIAASLKADSTLAPRDLDVEVKHGLVTLTGKVRSASEKTQASRIATVGGVTRVDNRIELDPKIDQSRVDAAAGKTKSGVTKAVDATVGAAEKTAKGAEKAVGKTEQGVGKAAGATAAAAGKAGDKMSDTSITTRVKAGFDGEALLKDTAINVDTTNRVVTIKGTVASTEARGRAAAIAADTEGVTTVVNELVVKGNE